MLIRFVVSNFLSFNQEREFNMIAGNLKTHRHHVYSLPKLNVLKAAAIYGANGAGKSNMIKAVEYLKELIYHGEVAKSIDDRKFKLNRKNKDLPATFEIEFFADGKTYAYGVSVNHTTVVEEWFYETGINKEDKLIFERKMGKNQKSVVKFAEKYSKTQKQRLLIELIEENLLKSNQLLISKADNIKAKEIFTLENWVNNYLVIIFPGSKFAGLVQEISTSQKFKGFANELLQTFDTGVRALEIESMDFDKFIGQDDDELKTKLLEEVNHGRRILFHSNLGPVMIQKEGEKVTVKKVVSVHNDNLGKAVVFDLNEESDGTQRMLDFIPAFNHVINDKLTFLIDEIDQSLHPVLLKALIQKVMNDENTQGQLIFTTHESNLLDLDMFRQDEIWFVEKDKLESSSDFYSLLQFKPRYDLDIKKGYLKGRFGAIPFLANLFDLNWHTDA